MMAMFEKESVGSNSSLSPSPPPPPVNGNGCDGGRKANAPSPERNVGRFVSPKENKNNSTCFYCKEQGHWVRDCPKKSPMKSSQPTPSSPTTSFSSVVDARGLPMILCPCGGGTCVVRVSKTPNNPGRKFYGCPLYPVKNCKFFKWCDDIKSSDKIIYPPTCRCGAGTCTLFEETNGPNAGRRFFVCPVKKGQGACAFMQLLDATNNHLEESTSSPQSTLTDCHDTSPSNSDLVEERDLSLGGLEIESSVEFPRNLGTSPEPSRKHKGPLFNFQGQEATLDESLRKHYRRLRQTTLDEPLQKHYKRLRHGSLKINGFILESTGYCQDMAQSKSWDPTMEKALQTSVLTSEAMTLQTQMSQISSARASSSGVSSISSYYNSAPFPATRVPLTQNCLERSVIYQILGIDVGGWFGRLMFPPSRCPTIPAPKPFFCCVFPSFDPISVTRDVNICDAEVSTIVLHSPSSTESNKTSHLASTQPLGALCRESLALKHPPNILRGKIMAPSILEVFEQAAVHLQNGLLSLLTSMDFHDHNSMVQEARSVFDALERLSVDYQSFKEQVMEFISRAASLTKVESSIRSDRFSYDLVDWYNRKKSQLEDISLCHTEACTALKASNEHIQSLKMEGSRLREMLFHIEAELLCCEAEKIEIGTRLDHITEDMLETEVSLQVGYEEAEKALKLRQQREAEWNVAKASFEKARSKLQQRL